MTQMKMKEVEFLGELLASMSDPFYLSYRFIALGELVTQKNDAIYKGELGVGIKELRILRIAQLHPGQPVNMIGRWTFTEKAMMSKLVSRLCSLGYLERRIDENDARSTQLFVTKTGKALVKAADLLGNKLFKQQFPSLSREACAALVATLDAILMHSVAASVTPAEISEPDTDRGVQPSPRKRRKAG